MSDYVISSEILFFESKYQYSDLFYCLKAMNKVQ